MRDKRDQTYKEGAIRMKKTVRFFAKVFLAVSAVTAVLFTIYMTNADSKLIEFIYDKLLHYHETKKVEDHIQLCKYMIKLSRQQENY